MSLVARRPRGPDLGCVDQIGFFQMRVAARQIRVLTRSQGSDIGPGSGDAGGGVIAAVGFVYRTRNTSRQTSDVAIAV